MGDVFDLGQECWSKLDWMYSTRRTAGSQVCPKDDAVEFDGCAYISTSFLKLASLESYSNQIPSIFDVRGKPKYREASPAGSNVHGLLLKIYGDENGGMLARAESLSWCWKTR